MKKILLTLVLLVGIVLGLFAQKLTYQAVIRDNNQQLVVNTAVKATVTITFTTGTPTTYSEEVNATTNLHGLLSIEFGDGSLVGRDWTDATIAVKVVNADDESTVYVGDDARPVSAVPYALSVNGVAIQQYLTEHHYVDQTELDNRHYLTSDSTVITTMQGNIIANATNITSLQSGLSAAISKEKTDSTTLAGRIDALEGAAMDCNKVKDCIKDTLSKYTVTDQLCNVVNNCDLSANASLNTLLNAINAKIDSLAHLVDSLAKLPHGGGEVADGQPCPGAPTVSDGTNTYNTVKIGNQCWMKENLRTTTKRNNVGNIYTDNPRDGYNAEPYGYYYDWAAVMQDESGDKVRGICPEGWHVPSIAEWDTLTNYVKSKDEYKCGDGADNIANALSSPTGWKNSSECGAGYSSATLNKTGFSAVPAGFYDGNYVIFGSSTFFWSATQSSSNSAASRYLYNNTASVARENSNKNYGFSVRCLRDAEAPAAMSVTTDSANTVTNNSATLHGTVTNMGGKDNVYAGFKYGTSESALTSIAADESAMDATGRFSDTITGLTANTQYYFKAFAANGTDTVYGEVKNFKTAADVFTCGTSTVKDADLNEYNTVQIGTQCWMKENLRTNVGSGVYPKKGDTELTADEQVTYGRLYTWDAMMNNTASTNYPESGSKVQGICPTGWHVPSDAEWTQLTTYVKSVSEYVCEGCSGTDDIEWYTYCIAKALSQPTGWSDTGTGCNAGNTGDKANLTGFSAVPAGDFYGSSSGFGTMAYFWSATQDANYGNWYRHLTSYDSRVYRSYGSKDHGYSVRCLRD